MKTKHLFFATALVASFASCTNDDIIEAQQGVANVERPTVDNVQLNFVNGDVESRLTFDGKYAWEATDTIGALLMDQPTDNAGKEGKSWTEQYLLSKWVNTSFPFTYNTANKTWSCAGKMLEGNYFFAFPWSSYDGARSVNYSFSHQEQNGIKGSVVAENYAKNQLFIGYAQIKGGNKFDVLTDVEMTNVLGAVQLRIKNTGETALHINRILLEDTNIKKSLSFNPTLADYEEYNLENSEVAASTVFNYANYVGDEEAKEYNIPEADEDYDRMEAIRKVVNYEAGNGIAQLTIKGENTLAAGETAYALIMVNPFNATLSSTGTKVKVYTSEGMITLTLSADNCKKTELNEAKTAFEVSPSVSNTIMLEVDAENLIDSDDTALAIYAEEDLEQLLAWNAGATVEETVLTATLNADVDFTKAMYESLKANKNLILNVVNAASKSYTLTLTEDLPADVLDYEGLDIDVAVAAEGTINLTKETIDLSSIKVLEGAALNINVLNANVPAAVTIDEDATLNIGAEAKTSNKVVITNNGAATIAEGALVQGQFNNNGTLALNGTANNLVNGTDAVVTMGEDAVINSGSNAAKADKKEAGIIYTAEGAVIASGFTNNGEIEYVEGADIKCSGARFVQIGEATLTAETYEEEGVNIFVLTGGKVTISETMSLATVKVKEGAVATITVDDEEDAVLTIGALKIEKEAALTTNGAIKVGTTTAAGSIDIAKDGEWTNNGDVELCGTFTSAGSTYNNGSVTPMTSTTTATLGTWKGNDYGTYDDAADVAQAYYTDAVREIWSDFEEFYASEISNINSVWYKHNPTDKALFAKTLVEVYYGGYASAGISAYPKTKDLIEKKLYPQTATEAAAGTANAALDAWKALEDTKQLKDLISKLNTTNFTAAVNAVIYNITDATKKANLKKEFIENSMFKTAVATGISQNNSVFKTEDEAYKTIIENFSAYNISNWENFAKYANVWNVISTTDIKNALNATDDNGDAVKFNGVEGKYVFVWDNCDLDAVVDVMVTLDVNAWKSVFGLDAATAFKDLNGVDVPSDDFYTLKGVQAFLKAAYTTTSTAAAATAAKTVAETYYLSCGEWKYSDTQVVNCKTND